MAQRQRAGREEAQAVTTAQSETPKWYDAPLPRRRHRCHPVQSGHISTGAFYERCACGGIRRNGGLWLERNSRRKR
jgi:hypothetical protein